MNYIAIMALILNLGVAGTHPQQRPVDMTFSGTSVASAINLQSGTTTGEENFGGDGSLGPFTYLEVQAEDSVGTTSGTCVGPSFFPIEKGAGVFRFQDGSLLTVKITGGGTCVDFAAGQGNVTVTYQVTGGTGLFKNASGMITLTATAKPVLFDATGAPVLFAATGEVTGTIAF